MSVRTGLSAGGFPPEFVDEVRRSAGIMRIVSDHVVLKKAGKGWKGLCPFHREKTPSFTVDEEKGLYYCFGCGSGGDVFRFLMQAEALTFPQAVVACAERSGVPLPERRSPDDRDEDLLLRAHEAALRFYREKLWGREGETARRYIADRGISDETARRFDLGWALPRWDGLLQALRRDFDAETLEKAGLVLRRADGRGMYDRFRGRLIFPIVDLSGRPVGFGGRTLPGAREPGDREEPKYLNSPETPLYRKGALLYALPVARRAIRDEGVAILVEGYMDTIALHQHGFPNAVAVLGTAFTSEQARLLARYCRKAFVNFDADEAGARAAGRSLDLLLAEGFEIRVVRLPKGEDPDSLLRKGGAGEYRTALRRARNYLDDLVEEAAARADLGDPAGKVEVLNSVLPFLARVDDRVVRSTYASRLAERLRIEDAVILDALKKVLFAGKDRLDLPEEAQGAVAQVPGPDERLLLRTLLEDPRLRSELLPRIDPGMVTPATWRVLLALRDLGEGPVDWAGLASGIGDEPARQALLRIGAERGEAGGPDTARAVVARWRQRRSEKRKVELTRRIEEAERAGDRDALARLQAEKMELLRALRGEP